jgi:hypothetical protein
MTGTQRTFTWINLVLAALVVVGVFVQVYLIAAYIFGAGTDALDAHKSVGNAVHGVEVLTFVAALVAFWKRWGEVAWSFALGVIGTVQLGFADGDEWVGGFHGLLALVVLILAAIVTHRAMRHLGLGHGIAPG